MLAERGGSLDEAVRLIQRALKIQPQNPSFLDSLGWAYFQQGNLDLADSPLTAAAGKASRRIPSSRITWATCVSAAAPARASRRAWERALSGDGAVDRS